MWWARDRQALSALLDERLERTASLSRAGHEALAQTLQDNRGILLEHIQRVDVKVDALASKVEALSTWRTRLEGLAAGSTLAMRYVAIPAMLFLFYLLYHFAIVKLFPILKI